jgi:cell wall-associated NlpC family hydrolase
MADRLQEFEQLVLGTPFLMYGRTPGKGTPENKGKVGIDCCGLAYVYLLFLGHPIRDFTSYQLQNYSNVELCASKIAPFCDCIYSAPPPQLGDSQALPRGAGEESEDGDILLFSKPGVFPLHVGVQVAPREHLHTSPIAAQVRRNEISDERFGLIAGIWRPRPI